jgi:hypothetical protein
VPQWEPLEPNPNDPLRYRMVSDGHDYRILDDPETGRSGRPWILAIGQLHQDGLHVLVHLTDHANVDDAKRAAEIWRGPSAARSGRHHRQE